MQDKSIGDGQCVYINKDVLFLFDMCFFYFELMVNWVVMQVVILLCINMFGEFIVQNFLSVLNYLMGSYYNKYENIDNVSSYLMLDNIWLLWEYYLNFNGFFYGIGIGNQESKLYCLMYECDYQGCCLVMGMVDIWNL